MKTEEPTTKAKKRRLTWGAVGHFLMYGGWLLIMAIVIGIILAASRC